MCGEEPVSGMNNSMINHLIKITCVHVCASMLPPTQASNLHVTNELNT